MELNEKTRPQDSSEGIRRSSERGKQILAFSLYTRDFETSG